MILMTQPFKVMALHYEMMDFGLELCTPIYLSESCASLSIFRVYLETIPFMLLRLSLPRILMRYLQHTLIISCIGCKSCVGFTSIEYDIWLHPMIL